LREPDVITKKEKEKKGKEEMEEKTRMEVSKGPILKELLRTRIGTLRLDHQIQQVQVHKLQLIHHRQQILITIQTIIEIRTTLETATRPMW